MEFLCKNLFQNTNLFIHIALIPEGDNPRVNPNILKCLLHSLVGEGVSASGDRLQSDSVQDTHLLPHNIKITTDPWGGGRDL